MINFKQLENIAGFETALNTIRTSEAAIRDASNEWAPLAISGVYAGDNVANVNNFINVFTGVRQSRITAICKRFLPYQFDSESGLFTKKDGNKPVIKRKADAYEAFLTSGDTFWSLVDEVKKADKKPTDYAKALQKATTGAMEQGLTLDQILAIVNAAVAAAAAAELLKAPAKDGAFNQPHEGGNGEEKAA